MNTQTDLEIFLVTVPGLEPALKSEAVEKGFKKPVSAKGGVTVKGSWLDVWRANLDLRGASKVLVRLGTFRAMHLAQLDKRARRFPWQDTLRNDTPVRVEVTCKKSKIYHQGAAKQRIETAITEELGAPISDDADLCIKVRIIEDLCTISLDTSGTGLHKRGHKEAVNKAPMRETLAALLLRQCQFTAHEPVLDPMCGSGTFVIEAGEIAANLAPGRSRSFAFEQLANFDETRWEKLKEARAQTSQKPEKNIRFYGFDRDSGAINISRANAKRSGIDALCHFEKQAISHLTAPDGLSGLVIVNPPYGGRIGETKKLFPLYSALGKTLSEKFKGWRVAIITNNDALAKTTELPFKKSKTSFSHGGIRVTLFQTDPLA
ncbi:MAG: THUMP domain-containing class I SAM-dependent RNA methyltransferase [Terasakiella sp.]|uniref:THUMP domain-containing class I SAM-dependent RNA methyltransferase n=1 Tax=unclassified Terasakiella TaxID=2614952 RepID=UPI003B00E20D